MTAIKKAKEPEEPKKLKRAKRVWNSDEIFHVWAHQRVEEGKEPYLRGGELYGETGRNIYFCGLTLYSYGAHFPVGTLIKNKKGVIEAVLLNSGRYSSTTSGHQWAASGATRHLRQFTVPNLRCDKRAHQENLKYFETEIAEGLKKAVKARQNRDSHLRGVSGTINAGNAYAAYFKLWRRFKPLAEYDLDALKVRVAEDQRKQTAAEKARNAAMLRQAVERYESELEKYREDLIKFASKLATWRRGKGDSRSLSTPQKPLDPRAPSVSYSSRDMPVYLRVRGAKNKVETNLGAVVPVSETLPLLKLLRLPPEERPDSERLRSRVSSWQDVPPLLEKKIGGYPLDWIDFAAEIVAIGCHRIPFAEIFRIVKQLKL